MTTRIGALLVAVAAVLTSVFAAGCGRLVEGRPVAAQNAAGDETLVAEYFERSNEAAGEGTQAQQEFMKRTQHPDVSDEGCSLGDVTLTMDPTLSTLRPDEGWRPQQAERTPRGRIYIVAVTVTVQRDSMPIGTQIGSIHVVVLDGAAYGFTPCPA